MAQVGPALVFVGFMGAGKTAAAAAVAEALGEPYVDADEAFLSAHGQLPGEYIAARGEEAFRAAEEELVLSLLDGDPRIVAVGGGAVESPRLREAIGEQICVWCDVDADTAWDRVQVDPPSWRPLAADRDTFVERYRRRAPIYESLATAVLPQGDTGLPGRAARSLAALRGLPGVRLLWATSASGDYPVYAGRGVLRSGFWPLEGRRFCVTDSNVAPLYARAVESTEATIEIAPGEGSKTLEQAQRVLSELAAAGMRRDDHLVALGGGVVGDLAGFCAASYQRGVAVIHVPTTLVAQVDSAYGGKTGVDLPEAKNYVGAYHMPAAVVVDPDVLASLPAAELAAGWVEVLKTGLLAGGALWERVRATGALEPAELEDLVFGCARFKIEVVAADERDAGRRQVLNLGHTVGHALEAATGYDRYRHGEAVGLGLLAALRLSGADELRDEVAAMLADRGLPVMIDPEVDTGAVLDAVRRDKKHTAEGLGFVLLERPAHPATGVAVEEGRVREAVEELRDES